MKEILDKIHINLLKKSRREIISILGLPDNIEDTSAKYDILTIFEYGYYKLYFESSVTGRLIAIHKLEFQVESCPVDGSQDTDIITGYGYCYNCGSRWELKEKNNDTIMYERKIK